MDATIAFDRFCILPHRRELQVDGRTVPLGARAFDVLLALVERRERLVSKDELLGLVWPGVVVEENNLQVQVSALRKALGPQVIATVAGRGYRFTAEPRPAAAAALLPTPTPTSTPTLTPTLTSALPPSPPQPAAGGWRLLVADDNKVNRLLLCRTLQLQGHDAVGVSDGRQALDLLQRERFDLLLLDLDMPAVDGFAVLGQLSGAAMAQDLPVIITSAVEGVDPRARCIELGAEDFLPKPVNPVLLKARVGATLHRLQLRRQQRERIAQLQAAAQPGSGLAGRPAAPAIGPCRTQAVVLAARLHDAVQVAAGQQPAEALLWLDACQTLLGAAVDGHGGLLVQRSAEQVTALFGSGAPAADGARAAARAALEMVELIEVFRAERQAAGQAAGALSVGLAAGELLLGRGGTAADPQLLCLGDAVHRAAALQALAAGAGQAIVADAAVQDGLAGHIAAQRLGAKGAEAADAVYVIRTG